MNVNCFGSGEVSVGIIGGIHGDEPGTVITVKMIEKFLNNYGDLDGFVKTVVYNEKAFNQNKRYIDDDLNRLFGSRKANGHENRLSKKIDKIMSDLDFAVSLHSSKSVPPAFCISNTFANIETDVLSLPVDYGVLQDANHSLETELDNVLNIELGHQHTNQVILNGIISCKSILANRKIIEYDHKNTKVDIIEHIDELEKLGCNPRVYYRNFESIQSNNIIAEDDNICHISHKDGIVPYLISKNGYNDVFGFIGEYKYSIDEDI